MEEEEEEEEEEEMAKVVHEGLWARSICFSLIHNDGLLHHAVGE